LTIFKRYFLFFTNNRCNYVKLKNYIISKLDPESSANEEETYWGKIAIIDH